MEPFEFEFEFETHPEDSYVVGRANDDVSKASVSGYDHKALIILANGSKEVGGIRLSPEDMDKLCKEWMDARRVCPFCHKPGMDVVIDKQPFMDAVETQWRCEYCHGEIDKLINPGSIPWEDPLEGTR